MSPNFEPLKMSLIASSGVWNNNPTIFQQIVTTVANKNGLVFLTVYNEKRIRNSLPIKG